MHQHLALEITDLETDLTRLVRDTANPALAGKAFGRNCTAAQLLVTAGDNPDRLSSEAAFAAAVRRSTHPLHPQARPPGTASTAAATGKPTPPCTRSRSPGWQPRT